MNVYVVIVSNCEVWDDYCEAVESVWTDRRLAVEHIEGDLGMGQVSFADPSKLYVNDRWLREELQYAQREHGETDEEWAEWLDEEGNPVQIGVLCEDARIACFELMGPLPASS